MTDPPADPRGDRVARPLLVGVVECEAESLIVRGPNATIRITGRDAATWCALLGRLDGRSRVDQIERAVDLPPEQVEELLSELARAQLLIDAGAWWRAFHAASGNPPRGRALDDDRTYERAARWQPPSTANCFAVNPQLFRLPPSRANVSRRSFPRDAQFDVDPVESESLALRIAHASYRRVERCRRPVASAGGLEPVHLITIGAASAGGPRRVLSLDDDASMCHELSRRTRDEVVATFIEDPVITEPVGQGAAVILICADPTRTVGKYGERGWRYVLLEAGAVSHHIALLAADQVAHCRPVGGFFDDRMSALTCGLTPLLAMLVIVESPAAS